MLGLIIWAVAIFIMMIMLEPEFLLILLIATPFAVALGCAANWVRKKLHLDD